MRIFSIVFVLLASISVRAQLKLPVVFDDHMVIQQQTTVPIWGWANPSENVTIKVSWDTVTIRTKADNGTFWKTTLKTPAAGGPHTITIKAGTMVRTLEDVLSGEVWIASGQSNMEWSMNASADGKPMVDQINDPNIRLLNIPRASAATLQIKGEGDWQVCNKESVGSFSAVAYFFGKKLNQNLKVPVGLINASWGGSPAETWIPKEVVEGNSELRTAAAKLNNEQPWAPVKPGVLFNAMINPFLGYTIKGALWYQGEANRSNPQIYDKLMLAMVNEWRALWNSGNFPFYYVQIAPFFYKDKIDNGASLVREAQERASKQISDS